MKKSHLYLFLLLFCATAIGQYRFSRIGIMNGLSQNSVQCIFQDHEGFIWIGTQDGLNRYDGYAFSTFRHSKTDSTTISDNFVTTITEDAAHHLWVGTRNGMNFFNKRTEKFIQVFPKGMDRNYFHNAIILTESTPQGVYFTSGGELYHAAYSEGSGSVMSENLLHISVATRFSCFDQEGNYFFIDSLGLKRSIISKDKILSATPIVTDSLIRTVTRNDGVKFDRLGRLWLSHDDLLAIYNFKLKKWEYKIELQSNGGSVMAEDKDGNMWIGGENGIGIWSRQAQLIGTVHSNVNSTTSLSSNNILSLYCDHSGFMWIGTAEGGANVCDPSHGVFMQAGVDVATGKGVSQKGTWSIIQKGKKLYVGTSGGIDVFDLKDSVFHKQRSFADNIISRTTITQDQKGMELRNVISLAIDRSGNVWAGTRKDGLYLLKDDVITKQWAKSNSEICGNTIFHINPVGDGTLWISTIEGLTHFDPLSGKFRNFRSNQENGNSLSANYVISSFEDSKGRIFCSTTNGLGILDPSSGVFRNFRSDYNDKNSLSYNIVTAVMEDSQHRIWVSTLGGGVDLFNEAAGKFTSWQKESGLANDVVYGMVQDRSGLFWMFTNSGISKYDHVRKTFVNYFTNDGIISNEFSQNGFFTNTSGEILLASPEGIMIFDPGEVSEQIKNYAVALTGYSVNYQKRIAFDISIGKEVTLDWDQRQLSFEFAALEFIAPERVNYQYKLEGFDNDWVSADPGQRIANYTSLPYGDYVFKVRTGTKGRSWSQDQLNIKVHVLPPFWLKPWCIVLECIVLLLLIVWVVRYFAQRKLKKRLQEIEVQRKLQSERERISRDLHDNVGAHLTYIINSLDNFSFQSVRKKEIIPVQKIDSLGEFARGTMHQLRETIWAINKESISVLELRDKLQQVINRFNENSGNPHIEIQMSEGAEVILQPVIAISIFRVIQEALNNAFKHAGAKRILISLEVEEDEFYVKIKDDGVGFDSTLEKEGHYGLSNMKNRIEELGGLLEITSIPGEGTSILIRIKI